MKAKLEELGGLMRAVSYLSSLDDEMSLTKLRVLLLIAQNRDEYTLARDLVRSTGLQQSTIARVLASLGEGPTRGKGKPLGLVSCKPDPEDPRRHFYKLSPKGWRVLSDLSAMVAAS